MNVTSTQITFPLANIYRIALGIRATNTKIKRKKFEREIQKDNTIKKRNKMKNNNNIDNNNNNNRNNNNNNKQGVETVLVAYINDTWGLQALLQE